MTNLKISSKMHVMIIVSALVLAIGLALGLVCQFVFGGYFNYGAEYASYKSVEVSYAYIDAATFGGDEGIKKICDTEFDNKGVSYYSCVSSETSDGWQYEFRFSANADETDLTSSVSAIQTKLSGENLSGLSGAYLHEVETQMGNTEVYKFGAIALAAAVAAQFIYFLIRYKLTMALAAFLADVHNFALFISLLAITRVPIGSQVVVFGILTVLMTMIGCAYFFGRMRKNLKDEGFATLEAGEQVDISVRESIANVAVTAIGVCAAAVAIFVLLSISALSATAVLTPVVLAVLGVASSFYGTVFFIPSVYAQFKKLGDGYKEKHSKKSNKA